MVPVSLNRGSYSSLYSPLYVTEELHIGCPTCLKIELTSSEYNNFQYTGSVVRFGVDFNLTTMLTGFVGGVIRLTAETDGQEFAATLPSGISVANWWQCDKGASPDWSYFGMYMPVSKCPYLSKTGKTVS